MCTEWGWAFTVFFLLFSYMRLDCLSRRVRILFEYRYIFFSFLLLRIRIPFSLCTTLHLFQSSGFVGGLCRLICAQCGAIAGRLLNNFGCVCVCVCGFVFFFYRAVCSFTIKIHCIVSPLWCLQMEQIASRWICDLWVLGWIFFRQIYNQQQTRKLMTKKLNYSI